MLGSAGSGAVLRDLERAGVPLVPLDPADSEYRHHALLGEMLRAELRRREPACSAELHRRAGAWHEHEGDVAPALEHAIEAGDVRAAGRCLWAIAGRAWPTAALAEVRAWLDRFRPEQLSAEPTLALTAATVHLADGDRDRIEHWAGPRSGCSRPSRIRRPPAAAAVVALRALVARDGAGGDGRRRRAGATSSRPSDGAWRPSCSLLRGAGPAPARRPRGRARAARGGRPPRRHRRSDRPGALPLPARADRESTTSDWEHAALLSSRARSQVERSPLAGYPASALVYAVSALVRAHRERVEAAQADRQQALTLLAELVDGPPWYELETRVALARATLRLGDVVETRALLTEARRLLPEIADSAPAAAWIEDCDAQAAAFTVASLVGPVRADHRRAARAAHAPDAPLLPRDGGAPAGVLEHHQDPRARGLPQAGRVLALRGGRPGPPHGPRRRVADVSRPPAPAPDAEAREPSSRRTVIKHIVLLLVAAVSLYLVGPAVLELFDAWPRVKDLDPLLLQLIVLAQVAAFACLWVVQRIALGSREWLPVITSQLAGNAAGARAAGRRRGRRRAAVLDARARGPLGPRRRPAA